MSYVYRRPHDYRVKPSPIFLLLAVAGAASGTAPNAFANTGTLTGTGALAGVCALTMDGAATSGAGAPMSGVADLVFGGGSSTLTATGALAGVAANIIDGTATGTAEGYSFARWPKPRATWRTLQADRWHFDVERIAVFPFTQPAGITGQADITFANTGTLVAAGSMSGVCALVFGGTDLLTGSGALAGSAPFTVTPTGTTTGTASGAVTGTLDFSINASATIEGAGRLSGVAAMVMDGGLARGAIVQISGVADFSIAPTGTARNAGAFTRPPRRRERNVFRW